MMGNTPKKEKEEEKSENTENSNFEETSATFNTYRHPIFLLTSGSLGLFLSQFILKQKLDQG